MLEITVSISFTSALVEAEELLERVTDPLELGIIGHNPAQAGAKSLATTIATRLGFRKTGGREPDVEEAEHGFTVKFGCSPELIFGNGTPKLGMTHYELPVGTKLRDLAHKKLGERPCPICQ